VEPVEIESLCPFQAAAVLWEPRAGEHRLTVCVKITLALAHGRPASLAPQQVPPHDDLFWDRNAEASLYAPSDFAPQKARADILLVGHAHAPGGVAVPSLLARLRVGTFVKTLHIEGDRVWTASPEGPRPSPSRPFTTMPLRYERAPAGPENPIGVDQSPHAVRPGWPLPNIYAAGETTITPSFGPSSPAWRVRRFRSGTDVARWAHKIRRDAGPAPPAMDLAFFNAAPPDQQVDAIPEGAEIVLENLCPAAPVVATRLPPLAPRAFRVSTKTGLSYAIPLRCDTLWIDGDRAIAVLCFRGVSPVQDPRAVGRFVVATEPDDRPAPMPAPAPGAIDPAAQKPASKSPAAATPPPTAASSKPVGPQRPYNPRRTQPLGPPSEEPPPRKAERPPRVAPVNQTQTAEFKTPEPHRSPERPPRVAPVNQTQTTEFTLPEQPRRPEKPPRIAPVNQTQTAELLLPEQPRSPEGRAPLPFMTPSRPRLADPALAGRLPSPSGPALPEVSVERCAAIAAELSERRATRAEILRDHGLSEAAWTAAERHWTTAVARESDQGSSELLAAFDGAYVAALERLRGPIRVDEYARLQVATERGDPRAALDELRLQRPAMVRIERVWARRLASDPALAARVAEAVEAERRR
jgi:hypothetical protein